MVFVSLRYAVMTFKSHSSYGVHIVYHLAIDRAGLTRGEITVITVLQVYANLACSLHLKLIQGSLCLGNNNLILKHGDISCFTVSIYFY